MRVSFLFVVLLVTGCAAHSAEEQAKAPDVVEIKESPEFEVHFKSQILAKQMSPKILSKPAESLQQILPLVRSESSMIGPIFFMTEYKGWFLFSDGSRIRRANNKDFNSIDAFMTGYAIKKGTNKLVLFGYCW